MKIVLPPIYEDSEDPSINGSTDFFRRQSFAQNLTKLFRSTDEGLVVSINSQWGDGKTTFIHRWINLLKGESDFITIHYDAYKNDFTQDAFLSIAAAIHSALEGKATGLATSKKQLKGMRDAIVKITKDSLKFASSIAVSNLTGGIANADKAGEIIGDFLGESLTAKAEQKLEAHFQAQAHIDEYRAMLEGALSGKGKGKRILFFVDELDRCRPDFAMQVLEKIKHLFSIKRVIFVLAINKSQIQSVIKHAYGVSDNDAEIYLQKFIHVETALPSIERAAKSSKKLLGGYIAQLITRHEMPIELFNDFADAFLELIGENYLQLNPRAIERVLTLVAMSFAVRREGMVEQEFKLLLFAAAIRIGKPICYFGAVKKNEFATYPTSDGGLSGTAFTPFIKKHLMDLVENSEGIYFGFKSLPGVTEIIDMFDATESEINELVG